MRISNLIALITAYVATSVEANYTGEVVHKVLKSGQTFHIANDLEHFSIQLLHKKLLFTARDFYVIDCKLITSIVGTVATYLVILTQLIHRNES
ncbi:putative gustatory receptor 28a [Lycorma delicatula]|uniref:putative gustatory receptor 28a n=1 Tax=Lycorma delicatula TaxID=130591 RepID=UPI003F516784